MDTKKERATPIGHTDLRVIETAYALAKTQNEDNAREILRAVPPEIYPALRKHMKEHANLFTPAIYAMVTNDPVDPKLSKVQALFA